MLNTVKIKSVFKSHNHLFSGEVVLFNIFYEVFTVCTSLVAEDVNGEYFVIGNIILICYDVLSFVSML